MEWFYESDKFGELTELSFWMEGDFLVGVFIPKKIHSVSVGEFNDIFVSYKRLNTFIKKYIILNAVITAVDSSGVCLFIAEGLEII